jgi:hypothetical protein
MTSESKFYAFETPPQRRLLRPNGKGEPFVMEASLSKAERNDQR